jgi:hypothetical protein
MADVKKQGKSGEDQNPLGHELQLQLVVFEILQHVSQAEMPRQYIGVQGVRKVLAYLQPPKSIPFDVFDWNLGIVHAALNLLLNLLQNGQR